MKATIAFEAGLVGAILMSVLTALARAMELTSMNISILLGSMLIPEPGATTSLVGLVWHLLNGGIIALFYALGFHLIGRANAKLGMLFGLIHWVAAGVFLGWLLPEIHPLIPEVMQPPGYFGLGGGTFDFVGGLILHLLYGMLVGGIYGRYMQQLAAQKKHRAEAPKRRAA